MALPDDTAEEPMSGVYVVFILEIQIQMLGKSSTPERNLQSPSPLSFGILASRTIENRLSPTFLMLGIN